MSVSSSNDGTEKAIDEYHDSSSSSTRAVVGGVLWMRGTLLVSLGFL